MIPIVSKLPPLKKPEYITAEFAKPFPEWWEGKPVLCKFDRIGISFDRYVIGLCADQLKHFVVAECDPDDFPENWDGSTDICQNAEPIPKPQPQDTAIAEALQLLKDHGYTVEIKKELGL